MATRDQHLKQWEHNRSFLASLLRQPDNSDWMTTVTFYAAVHAVQVLLVSDGHKRCNTHDARNDVLLSVRRYDKIWPDYKALYDASRASRYDCSGWLTSQAVLEELVKKRLLAIERQVIKLGKLPIELPDLLATPYSPEFIDTRAKARMRIAGSGPAA